MLVVGSFEAGYNDRFLALTGSGAQVDPRRS
jgi:hypothetical protein